MRKAKGGISRASGRHLLQHFGADRRARILKPLSDGHVKFSAGALLKVRQPQELLSRTSTGKSRSSLFSLFAPCCVLLCVRDTFSLCTHNWRGLSLFSCRHCAAGVKSMHNAAPLMRCPPKRCTQPKNEHTPLHSTAPAELNGETLFQQQQTILHFCT